MHYSAELQPNGIGGFIVTFPDVPSAVTEGADRDEALSNAQDALEVALLGLMKVGQPLPSPSPSAETGSGRVAVAVSAQVSAKLAFYEAFRQSGKTRVALAKQLGKPESEIRRMLDPWHATKLTSLEAAMAALGKRLVVTVEEAA